MPSNKRGKRSSKRSDRPKPPRFPRPQVPDVSAAPAASGSGARAVAATRSLADWPVHEALINEGWDDPDNLATIIVARHHPRYDSLVVSTFLVDLQCLGVKEAMYQRVRDTLTYTRRVRPELVAHYPPLMAIEPALAAKIVATGLDYADGLGFKPHADFAQASVALDGLDPGDDPTPIVVGGADGKPFFVAGPYDDAKAIMAQLTERLGEDGFHFMATMGHLVEGGVPDPSNFVTNRLADSPDLLRKVIELYSDVEGLDYDDEVLLLHGGNEPLFTRLPKLASDELSHVVVRGLRDIPDGEHPVIELYCPDLACDCRRVILYVMPHPNRPPVATINFSWADAGHLKRWMGNSRATPAEIADMQGPILEPLGPQSPQAYEIMKMVEAQLLSDPAFVARLARHYTAFRAAPAR